MMDILFKGKRIDNGDWIEGGYSEHEGKTFIVVWKRYIPDTRDCGAIEYYENNPHYNSVLVEVDPETVCQYTGLTDKNNLKIFEGDILHFTNQINNHEWLCVVELLEGSFVCRYIEKEGELGDYNHFSSWHDRVEWEVIGNIFDNPELLKSN